MKYFLVVFFFYASSISFADDIHYPMRIIKIHFLHGSKPKKEFKNTEHKVFGGIHGGHVTIELDNEEYGFNPTKKPVHIFSNKMIQSSYVKTPVRNREEGIEKTTSFVILISLNQYFLLRECLENYLDNAPYDYAFFGMRCAASTREILE
jgi:hypothetical protein